MAQLKPSDYQRHFKVPIYQTLSVWEVTAGRGKGDLYAVLSVVEDHSGEERATITNQEGKSFVVAMSYLKERCYCLTQNDTE
jgi:hypothetical protein